MPRYKYVCLECEVESIQVHGISESAVDCGLCETSGSLQRSLTTPTISRRRLSKQKQEVGSLTNEYIEENRKILKDMKKEIVNKNDKT